MLILEGFKTSLLLAAALSFAIGLALTVAEAKLKHRLLGRIGEVSLWLSTATSYLALAFSVAFSAPYATWEAFFAGVTGLQAQLVLIRRSPGRIEGRLEARTG